MEKDKKFMKEYKNCKRLVIFGIAVVAVFIIAALATSASAEIIEVSQPTQVTSDSYYERGHSLCYNGSSYWMFYGRSTEDNQPYASCNPDDSNYELYYKQASSISGLASATATQLGSITDVYQGQTSCAYYNNEVWVFYADSSNNIEYFTFDTSWTGPTDTGFDGNGASHLWVAEYDGNLHIVYNGNNGTDNVLLGRYYNGSSWSSADQASTNEGMPRLYNDTNGDLYLTWCSWGMPAYYIHKYNGGWSTTANYSVTGTANDDCDPWLFENSDGNYSLMFAPWDGTQQFIAQWTASTLSGLDSATDHIVTQGSYTTSNPWVDMWPTVIDDGSDQYLFYISERNPNNVSNEIAGNIWYMKIDWNMSHDHYTYIQNAIDAASDRDMIVVYNGIYNESVTIDKELMFLGAKADVDPRGGVWDNETSIIDPGAGNTGIEITAANVTVNGFEITGGMYGILVNPDTTNISNVTIRYNDLYNNSKYGCQLIDLAAVLKVTEVNLSRNYFHHNGRNGLKMVDVTECLIDSNEFAYNGFGSAATKPEYEYGIFLEDERYAAPIYCPAINNTFTRNSFHDNNKGAINMEVLGSASSSYWTSTTFLEGTVVHYNNFYGNSTVLGLVVDNDYNDDGSQDGFGPIAVVNATCNWWGHPSGPYQTMNNSLGIGVNVTNHVDFIPWLDDEYPYGSCIGGLSQDPVYVDDDYNSSTPGWNIDHFASIHDGINRVYDGGTVYVANGTYNVVTQILIDKALSLIGEGSATTIIDGPGSSVTIPCGGLVAVDGISGSVIIKNFTLQDAPERAATWEIYLLVVKNMLAGANVTIEDNILIGRDNSDAFDGGIWIAEGNASSQATIRNNDISKMYNGILLERMLGPSIVENNDIHHLVAGVFVPDTYAAQGLYYLTYTGDVTTQQLARENTFRNYNGYDILFQGGHAYIADGKFTNVKIQNNTVNAIGSGPEHAHVGIVLLNDPATDFNACGVHNAEISGNIITTGGADSIGVNISGHNTGINLFNNNITNLGTGIFIEGTGTPNVTVHYNNIYGNTNYGINNTISSIDVNVEYNWWGHASGANHTSNPHGIGQGGDAVSDNVDFTPWYATSTTTPSTEHVSVIHNPIIAYSDTIQGGIDAACSDDTINVVAGTYIEQVRINKTVTISGESESGVIINPDGLEYEGPRTGIDSVRAAVTFETGSDNAVLQYFTVANNGYASDLNGNSGIEIIDGNIDNILIRHVTVSNVSGHGFGSYHTDHTWPSPAVWIIENCSFSTSNTSTWSGMRPQNMDNLTIKDCDIGPTNYGGILLINSNDTAVVQRCMIHDTVRAGIQVDSYCTGTIGILDNEIWATNSAHASDYGDIRLYGQYLPDPHGDIPATVTIQGNLLRDGYNGVCVKSGQNISTRTVLVHWNNIMNHSNYGALNAGIGMLDAKLNYWGDATGPYHSTNTGGLGDNVSDNVDFYPWAGGNPPWDVTLNLKEDGNAQIWDTAIFGEKIDASDGQDSFDVPKPGSPPSPYINGWFDADLSAPYNRLWKDYRHFPAENIWDLYVQANTNSGTTDVNISWNITEIGNSEYGYVGLYDETGTTFLADMTTSTNYVLTGVIDNIPYHLKIKCRILGLHQVSIKTKWNLISIPCYENISKNNIIIRNNSIEYNWTTAVNEGIMLDYIYKWKTTSEYGDTSTLEPGLGYWIWTYYDCEMLIPSNAEGTGDIADMQQKWNIRGLPYTTSLDKENLIVHYNGTDYSWENATSNNNPTGGPIILGFIYAWDEINQIYILSDEFDPGYGYWMYAYYMCTLKK